MKIVLQRVKEAAVTVAGEVVGQISFGLLVFVAVAKTDTTSDADYLADKIVQLRIFEDRAGKMNLSLAETGAQVLVVSQFTLLGNCLEGRRPSFDAAAQPKEAEVLYTYFVERLRAVCGSVATGQFRARMEVALVNDGPVTFVLDTEDHLKTNRIS